MVSAPRLYFRLCGSLDKEKTFVGGVVGNILVMFFSLLFPPAELSL